MIYHISEDGKPRPCKAEKIGCPIGGAHFQSKLSAIAFLEGEALREHGGSFGSSLDRDQRYRLARSNELPAMRYDQNLGDAVYDRYGNEWKVTAHESVVDTAKPIIQLRRTKDGKVVTLDPRNEVHTYDTEVQKDVDTGEYGFATVVNYLTRKETGNWTIRDFYETVPEPIVLDKPPVRNSKKYAPIPLGTSTMKHAALRHVNVHTSVDSPVESRWLIVERNSDIALTQKEHREITKAAYEQTGRALSSFAKLSDFQKSEFANFEWRPIKITHSGDAVALEQYTASGESFKVTGETIRPEDIAVYKLD